MKVIFTETDRLKIAAVLKKTSDEIRFHLPPADARAQGNQVRAKGGKMERIRADGAGKLHRPSLNMTQLAG